MDLICSHLIKKPNSYPNKNFHLSIPYSHIINKGRHANMHRFLTALIWISLVSRQSAVAHLT